MFQEIFIIKLYTSNMYLSFNLSIFGAVGETRTRTTFVTTPSR